MDPFDKGSSPFRLQEQALWGCHILADRLQEIPAPPRVSGQVPLYERILHKGDMVGPNGTSGAPPGFPATQFGQPVVVNGDNGKSYM